MMSSFRGVLLSAILGGSLAMAACGGGYSYSSAYVAPPPPAPYAAMGYAPGPGFVWAAGFWDLRGGRWVWSEGRWMRPPRGHGVWVHPYWESHGRGYRFHRGYWR